MRAFPLGSTGWIPEMLDATDDIRDKGFAQLEPNWAGAFAPDAWEPFAASWNDLPRDLHMGDGGRYRSRRFLSFRVDGAIERLPHAPHFQRRAFNALNGGVPRWYAPIRDDVVQSAPFETFVRTFVALADVAGRQHLEAHQFRIESGDAALGLPTPEGLHRDDRDWVLIVLIGRRNAAGGASRIHDLAGRLLLEVELASPGAALLLDDHRVQHAVTPVAPAAPGAPALRDVLVLTLAADQAASSSSSGSRII